MFAAVNNNSVIKWIPLDTPFEINGVQYPANWLRLTTAKEKQDQSIYEVIDIRSKDERFYYETGFNTTVDHSLKQVRRDYTYTPKDLSILKQGWIAQARQTVSNLLSQTDWYVTRRADIGTPIPSNITAYRLSIRTYFDTLEGQVNTATTHEQLISIVANISWPKGE